MALSEQDLEEAIIALRYAADGGVFPTGDRLFVEALKPLVAEMSRRKVGPFTLAEAVASGRPFRRAGGKLWSSGLTEDSTPCGRCEDVNGGDGIAVCFNYPRKPREYADPVRDEDITATDYELQEGGE